MGKNQLLQSLVGLLDDRGDVARVLRSDPLGIIKNTYVVMVVII